MGHLPSGEQLCQFPVLPGKKVHVLAQHVVRQEQALRVQTKTETIIKKSCVALQERNFSEQHKLNNQ